jgi:hypothetical protein
MKDIKGFEGRYAICEDGRIWSYPNRRNSFKGMWLKAYKSKTVNGRATPRFHWSVSLFDNNGKRTVRQVHRLVAEAYIPNEGGKPIVNHIDGNSLNPHRDNLEWVTNKENSAHAFSTGLVKKPMTNNEVIELRKICKFYSCRKVALAYGLHPGTVWDINSQRRYADVP